MIISVQHFLFLRLLSKIVFLFDLQDTDNGKLRYRGNTNQQRGGGGANLPATATVFNSRKLLETAKANLNWDSDNSDDEDMKNRDDGFMAVKGEPGLYYKVFITVG